VIEVLHPGPFASVQDTGRRGYAALGVARGGAFDRGALRLANRLVGNRATAAAIEMTLGGLVAVVRDAATLALTGAWCPGDLDWGVARTVPAGSTIRIGAPPAGVRSYLAVRGGLDVPVVLGSRATDTLGGLGPRPLRAGDLLALGSDCPDPVSGAAVTPAPPRRVLRCVVGPREEWFEPDAPHLLRTAVWTVRAESDRIGVRFDGPRLRRANTGELPSEPTLPGALQVPPDGRPILLGPDAPVTGGYPVIAVVRDDDLDAAAQLRPGDSVTLLAEEGR
jgi:biotin-dependent carboxylase-like uncharacterized protein